MKKRLVLLMMVMGLLTTGCGGAIETGSDIPEVATEKEVMEVVEVNEDTKEETTEIAEDEVLEMSATELSEKDSLIEATQTVPVENTVITKETEKEKTTTEQKVETKPQTPAKQESVVEEPVLENADHPFFEVFFVEHRYKNDGEYYYWGFYMPYECDTDNCPEYDEAYAEVMSKMKGEVSYVFFGLDGEFADLGEYSFVRMGYKVPTEYMPETLTILYDDNVYWGKAGYIVYYTEEEWSSERWSEVYWEFHDKYVVYDEEGRMNLYYDTRYFVDGELKCFYVWEK